MVKTRKKLMAVAFVVVMAVAMLPMTALTAFADTEQSVEINTTGDTNFREEPISISAMSYGGNGVQIVVMPGGYGHTATVTADSGYVISKIEATVGLAYGNAANLVASSGTLSVSDSTVTISDLNDSSVIISNDPSNNTVCLSKFKVYYKELAKDAEPAVAKTGLVYNGEKQTGTDDSVSAYILIEEDYSATDAGTYTATMTPIEGHAWKDTGTTETRNVEWSIAKYQVDIPVAADGLVYNGEEQVGVEQADGALYALEGNTGTNAGQYVATAFLTDTINYTWASYGEDVSSDDQTIEWSIAKKGITISWDKDSFTYDGKAHLPKATASDATAEIVTDPSDGYTQVGTYTVTASLAPDTSSEINFTITEGATHEFTITVASNDDNNQSTIAKTGDNALPFALALIAVAAAGFGAYALRRSRQL